MPIDPTIKSVLVIGSGPIVIGQACEFDYSGTQACRVLRAEGIRVILVNSNPATIMTDPEFADATYIEPITPEFIERIIMKEKPDAVLATLGGQTALNAAMGMHAAGILDRHGVRLIGADVEAISRGENRELFRAIVEKVGGESARSIICHTMDDVLAAASNLGFPCVIRPSFTMGGLGSGIAYDQETLQQIAGAGLRHSPTSEVLIEESIIGWKEFELEVMRDKVDNVVIVCSIENIDPMGVHTGDSITVAPALTLTDVEYQKLRDLSIDIIREVGVDTGGCNIQYAVNPDNGRIIVIEMNPRVSRSSALASKATGFPIAKIATKLAIGYTLDEIKNDITQVTPASFEPTLDYIVVKAPRFAFEKFQDADARLTTTMKSVGEAMAIGRSFPEALMKVLRSLERKEAIFKFPANLESIDVDALLVAIATPTEYRLQEVQTLLWAGVDAEKIYQICKIDRWYLKQIQEINEAARKISELGELSIDLLRFAKSFGFSDSQIGLLRNVSEDDVRKARQHFDLHPVYKTVDTCAAEFQAHTPYHYSSYEEESEVLPRTRPAVVILGSGPNRIGQGIEFDYSCVHASFTLREADFETIMINCNPETVSTDYDTSNRLYFEPLTLEDVLEVIHAETLAGPVLGVITQLGGQTPLGLAAGLKAAGVNILGTSPEAINLAEERGAFGELLLQRNLTAPEFGMAASQEEAILIAQRIGYPVLVRPSFVLGGRGMEIVYDDESLSSFISRATDITPDRPVLVDRFLDSAIELDVDALYDGHELFLGGIMEHIEEAGIHSGDSACVLPAMTITEAMRDEVRLATLSIAEGVGVRGLINIQFAVADNKLYVLEANPRASRTVPFVSKATGVPLAKAAARISVGSTIAELREIGLLPLNERHVPKGVSVKEAVLPWNRFRRRDGRGVDAVLGPEMRSTGEVMGISKDFGGAYAKSQISSFGPLPKLGSVFISLADKDKSAGILPARALAEMGFQLFATAGTASFLESHQVKTALVRKHSDGPGEFGERTIVEILNSGEIDLVINTPVGRGTRADGWAIRTAAVQRSIPIITTTPGFSAAVAGIRSLRDGELDLASLQEWLA
jgi:carbamoyl-phosphate synthase large subunit